MYFLQMSGFPGSGKSTLARRIAKITGAIIVDHDISKTAILKATEGLDIGMKSLGKISYTVDWDLVEFHLSQGHDVIFDVPCLYSEMLDNGLHLAKKYRARYKYVECFLSDYKEICNRLQNRKRMISQISETTEELFISALNGSKRPLDIKYLVIDSSQSIESYLHDVLDYIKEE
ncbi:ATP-binding protein [Paenibacillus glucanolyticus]|uniref:AAA family ATPase n=1 Tax=Paenibacillus TaxID=44249 RepID=UPI0003E21C4D|nr:MULTISPECIES: AAA family ATPase [Paenibacillus]ANA82321.1 ATP-binding protein [Paenibacillus glucanolyticus]AVV58941.1 ATP-binding protein [Paenibacillus glucanolyticus]ETT34219.1 ATP-binding protein (P-loop) [Paenibacillus sp. FSL R5-808]MPY17092.1 ATP-binding protein [Paenibacillus glucanolyticus]